MKNLYLKLSKLSKESFDSNKMNGIYGGRSNSWCGCACAYEGQTGGSSTADNGGANASSGKHSPGDHYKYVEVICRP